MSNVLTAAAFLHEPVEGPAAPIFSCRTRAGRADVYDCIEAIDQTIWQALFPSHWKSFDYYRTLADTFPTEFPQRYVVLRNERGETVAIQPFFFVRQDLTVSLPGALRRVLLVLRRHLLPRFLTVRMMMVGCIVGEGQSGLDPALSPEEHRELLAALDEALAHYAEHERVGLRIWKEFPAETRRELNEPLEHERGHVRIPSLPAVSLDLEGVRDFDDFLETRLGKATRKNLRRKFRAAETFARTAGSRLKLEVKNYVSDAEAAELHMLYERVARRGDIHFEVFTKDYFLLLSQRMPEQAHFFIWWFGGRIVAFAFCMIDRDTIHDNDIGLDYDFAHNLHLYHTTFRDLLEWAIARGLRRYRSSPFSYDPKLRLRMELVPLDLYVRHRSDFVQFFLRRLAPLLEPTRQEPLLRDFHNFAQVHAD